MTSKLLALVCICVAPALVQAQKKTNTKTTNNAAAQTVQMKNETDSASYALGILISRNLVAQGIDTLNPQVLADAMKQILHKKPVQLTDMQAQQVANNYSMDLKKKAGAKNLKKSEDYLAKNKLRPGVITTPSGLQYEVMNQGPEGPKPGPASKCKVHYHGTLTNGTVFDSSVERGQPLLVNMKPGTPNSVIPSWVEAVQLMTVGTKLKIYCHPNIAYGAQGSPPKIGPNEVLIFEMELISIEEQ